MGSYEIELKALLSREKYDELKEKLRNEFELINEESLNTIKFINRNNDIRLRYSDKTFELVFKDKGVMNISRNKNIINLNGKNEVDNFVKLFKLLGFKEDSSWITHKNEFKFKYKDYNYNISLQDIENFAYIMEVEFLSSKEDKVHEENIKEIIKKFGLEPIKNNEFSERIKKYIKENKVN